MPKVILMPWKVTEHLQKMGRERVTRGGEDSTTVMENEDEDIVLLIIL